MTDSAAINFVLGVETAADIAELRERVLRWADQRQADPLPLNRMLGLGSCRATRLSIRDALLTEASGLLTGTRWSRCKQLAESARTFNVRRYNAWRRSGVPAGATDLDLLLFKACEIGEKLPETPEQLLNILPAPG